MPALLTNTTADAITEPVDAAAAKKHTIIEHDADDDLLTGFATRAREIVEREIGSPVAAQTFDWQLDCFPKGAISLPHHPIQTTGFVIKYFDTDGVERTLDPSEYLLTNPASGLDSTVQPQYGKSWPEVEPGYRKVTISFTAGYADDEVPGPIVQAICMLVAEMYGPGRGDTTNERRYKNALRSSNLIDRYKQYR